ncbi:MAG: phosphotransferase [Bacilli bacterium]|nr:phosphotransferase [Bacilli bacterium]MBN2877086.1 phosphotransferase [Bacilli bacterium]
MQDKEGGYNLEILSYRLAFEIHDGWSHDKKYCVEKDSKKYLLRICENCDYESKRIEFDMMQQLSDSGAPMCKLIEYGENDKGVYSIWEWIEGDLLEKRIGEFSPKKQYLLGIESGKILKDLHFIEAPDTIDEWEKRYSAKIDRVIRNYQNCNLKYPNGELFIDFVNTNRDWIKDRPQVFQHGDYHSGNIMIDANEKLVAIDFNRNDFGDPWEEFNRIVWSAQDSAFFASGMVDGYFDGVVPNQFWQLMALYVSCNALSSLPWSIPFGEGEVTIMYQLAKTVLDWYDNLQKVVPKWYVHP